MSQKIFLIRIKKLIRIMVRNNKEAKSELDILLNIIATRRSIRKFKKKKISDSDIQKLIWAATMAPSGGNLQPWHFIVIKNEKLKVRLSNIILDDVEKLRHNNLVIKDLQMDKVANHIKRYSTFFKNAPIVIAILVKFYNDHYFDLIMEYMKVGKYDASILSGFVEIQSISASIENLLLVAHCMGYGSCWVRIPFCSKDNLERQLNVKNPWHLTAFIPIGLPDEEPKFTGRKAVESVMTTIK